MLPCNGLAMGNGILTRRKMDEIFSAERIFFAGGREWRIGLADMDRLWETMTEREGEERAPYWNEIWPSSLALADWLFERKEEIRERRCLDMGCGLGFTALLGRWLGADVLAMDYEEEAVELARHNAEKNGVTGVRWRTMDWREPELPEGSVDFLWAADIMYEAEAAEPIAGFLRHALALHGKAWIAEPGRTVFRHLPKILPSFGLSAEIVRKTPIRPLIPQSVPVPVTIWEIKRKLNNN